VWHGVPHALQRRPRDAAQCSFEHGSSSIRARATADQFQPMITDLEHLRDQTARARGIVVDMPEQQKARRVFCVTALCRYVVGCAVCAAALAKSSDRPAARLRVSRSN